MYGYFNEDDKNMIDLESDLKFYEKKGIYPITFGKKVLDKEKAFELEKKI